MAALGGLHRRIPAVLLAVAVVGCAWAAASQRGAGTPPAATKQPSQSSEGVGPEASNLEGKAAQLFRDAKALFAEKQYAKAVPVLQEAEKVAPAEQVIHHYLGYALWKEDRFKEAGQEFERAHRLDPKNAYSLYFLGRVYDAQGETSAAVRSYESEFALGTPVYDTYQRLAVAYLRRGEPKKALEMVQRGLQATPWESSLHYQLARIYQQTGHPKEAKEEFDATNRLKQSDQASIQKLLDLSVAIQEKNAESVTALRQELLVQTPRDPEIMHSLGLVLGCQGPRELTQGLLISLIWDLGEILREFQAHPLARALNAALRLIQTLEEAANRDAQCLGDLEQASRGYSVDAAFVLVRLLIGDSDQVGELLLG